jgi:hypothetical protein
MSESIPLSVADRQILAPGGILALVALSMMVIAKVFTGFQFVLQEFLQDVFDGALYAYVGCDVILCKEILCPGAHAAGDDAFHSPFRQVARQETGLVARVGDLFPGHDVAVFDVDECVCRAASEMSGYVSALRGYR